MGEFNSEMVVVAIKKKVVFSSHLSENHNMQYVCVSWSFEIIWDMIIHPRMRILAMGI